MQRQWRLLALAATVGVAVLGGLAAYDLSDVRRDPELTATQWNRLLRRWSQRAEALRDVAPPASEAVTADVAEAEIRPVRLHWPTPSPDLVAHQREAYDAQQPKSVIELQPFRRTQTIDTVFADGERGTAVLINLNPTINTWYVLTLRWSDGRPEATYHLANTAPDRHDLVLDASHPSGVVVADSMGQRPCDLWSSRAPQSIAAAAATNAPYVALCDGAVSLRLRTAGHKTSLENVTDFLRNRIWGGEALTVLVRSLLFKDAFLETADTVDAATRPRSPVDGPRPATLSPERAGDRIRTPELGIQVEGAIDDALQVGHWHPARGNPGVFVSVIRPDLIADEILHSHTGTVGAMDDVERQALSYLVAFDLSRFDVEFAMGTDHPRVNWSDRPPAEMRDPALPGPDGIGTVAPLVSTGIVGPGVADRLAATFTGGFKRTHGAFRYGPLASTEHGTHYGFVENGVVLSKLRPGLSTLLVMADGSVEITAWSTADDPRLEQVRFARQNGVPLLAFNPRTGMAEPGELVSQWGSGNWSGSQDGRLRSLRAGVCVQDHAATRFLVYGYFSSATPAAMVRVFQAYGCRDAMHLDMNALEHTYAAVYRIDANELVVDHLIREMRVLDKEVDGVILPRFLGYADNRDFFYLLWRDPSPEM